MKIYVDLGRVQQELNVWTIKHEKEYLLLNNTNLNVSQQIDTATSMLLNIDPSKYSQFEKMYMLLLCRTYANGEYVEFTHSQCNNCGQITKKQLALTDSLRFSNNTLKDISIGNIEFHFQSGNTLENSIKYIKVDGNIVDDTQDYIDNLHITTYDKLVNYYDNNSGSFYISGDVECELCQHKIKLNLNNYDKMLSWLTTTNIKNYYMNSMYLLYKCGLSISDYENMLPFEVDIYVGQLTDILKREQDG